MVALLLAVNKAEELTVALKKALGDAVRVKAVTLGEALGDDVAEKALAVDE